MKLCGGRENVDAIISGNPPIEPARRLPRTPGRSCIELSITAPTYIATNPTAIAAGACAALRYFVKVHAYSSQGTKRNNHNAPTEHVNSRTIPV